MLELLLQSGDRTLLHAIKLSQPRRTHVCVVLQNAFLCSLDIVHLLLRFANNQVRQAELSF